MRPGTGSQPSPVRPEDSPRTLPITTGYSLPTPQPSRFVAPEIVDPAKRRPLPTRAVLVTFALAILAGLVLGISYVRFRPPNIDPDTEVSPSGDAPHIAGMASPQEAARAYFTALERGDIDAALALGELGGEGSTALLTPAAYNLTRDLARVTELRIMTRDESAKTIQVSYLLGDAPSTTDVAIQRQPDDTYRLARTTSPATFVAAGEGLIPLLVNGTPLPADSTVQLVPGRYELSTGLAFLDYSPTNHFTLTALTEEPHVVALTPELNDTGETALLAAARQSLTDCLTAKSLTPQGCPFSIQETDVDESSVVWSLVGDPWPNAVPGLAPDDPTKGQVQISLTATVAFRYANGQVGSHQVQVSAVATANMLGKREDALSITWEP